MSYRAGESRLRVYANTKRARAETACDWRRRVTGGEDDADGDRLSGASGARVGGRRGGLIRMAEHAGGEPWKQVQPPADGGG